MYKNLFKFAIVIYCAWNLLKLVPARTWNSLEERAAQFFGNQISKLIFDEK